VEQWQRLGVDNTFLDSSSVRRYVGGGRYQGAILYSGGATLNPLSLSRELTRACLNQGVSVFSGALVQQMQRNAQRWYARTTISTVRARTLVLATDAYTEQLWPELRRAYSLWRVSLVASSPYSASSQVLPARVPFAEFSLSSLFTLRNGPGSSLVISTHAPARANRSPSEKAAPFVRRFRQVFPDAPEPQWATSHDGYCGLTPDMLPRISQIGPDAWAAYGYSGSGINLGLLMGGELAHHVRGAAQHDGTYPVTPVKPVTARRIVEGGLKYILAPLSRGFQGRFSFT
jgi:sarcosine oxidase